MLPACVDHPRAVGKCALQKLVDHLSFPRALRTVQASVNGGAIMYLMGGSIAGRRLSKLSDSVRLSVKGKCHPGRLPS